MGVRIGIIGMGAMGRRHLEAFRRDGRVEIVGVADVVPETARAAAEAVGAQACDSLAELAALGVDAVVVSSPNVYHDVMVLEALDRGLHVLSEKPMATTLDGGRRIRDRVRAGDRVYQIGFNRRWAPAYQFLRQRVTEGFIPYSAGVKINDGDMLTPSWYSNAAVSGGFMYDTAVHLFDMIAWLIGPVERVAAIGRKSCYPDYDDVVMWLICRGDRPVGLTTCGHASWAAPQERVELYGDHALLVSEDLDRARHTTRDDPHAPWQHFSAPDMLTLWGYVDEDRAFIDACLGLASPPITVDDAFHSLAVLDAAYASLAAGGAPVRVATE